MTSHIEFLRFFFSLDSSHEGSKCPSLYLYHSVSVILFMHCGDKAIYSYLFFVVGLSYRGHDERIDFGHVLWLLFHSLELKHGCSYIFVNISSLSYD